MDCGELTRGRPLLFERLTNCYSLQIHFSVHQPTPAQVANTQCHRCGFEDEVDATRHMYSVSYITRHISKQFYCNLLKHIIWSIVTFGEQSVRSLPSSFNAGITLSVGRCTYRDVLRDSKYAQNTHEILNCSRTLAKQCAPFL